MLRCDATIPSRASGSGTTLASLAALAAMALPMLLRQTTATSGRSLRTHIRAMFSQTFWLQQKQLVQHTSVQDHCEQ